MQCRVGAGQPKARHGRVKKGRAMQGSAAQVKVRHSKAR